MPRRRPGLRRGRAAARREPAVAARLSAGCAGARCATAALAGRAGGAERRLPAPRRRARAATAGGRSVAPPGGAAATRAGGGDHRAHRRGDRATVTRLLLAATLAGALAVVVATARLAHSSLGAPFASLVVDPYGVVSNVRLPWW